jgi:hypothetical protein
MEKSNRFLKVTGILMIIGGSFNLLASVLALLFGAVFVDAVIHTNLTGAGTVAAGVIIAGIVFIIAGSVIQFTAGVFGAKNANNPKNANGCIVFGVLTALVYLVSQLLNLVGGGVHNYLDVMIVIFGLIVPALYIVGAVQLKMKD